MGKGESANAQFQQRLWPLAPILKAQDARGAPILGTGIGCGPRRGAAGASLGTPGPPVLAGRAAPGAGDLPRTVDTSKPAALKSGGGAGTEALARGPHAARVVSFHALKSHLAPSPAAGATRSVPRLLFPASYRTAGEAGGFGPRNLDSRRDGRSQSRRCVPPGAFHGSACPQREVTGLRPRGCVPSANCPVPLANTICSESEGSISYGVGVVLGSPAQSSLPVPAASGSGARP